MAVALVATVWRPCYSMGSPRFTSSFRSNLKHNVKRCSSLTAMATISGDRGASGLDVQGYRPTTPKAWDIVSETLLKSKLKFITGDELVAAMANGTPVVDIRPANEFDKGHIEGSVNVPLYQPISGWDGRSIARRVGFAFFGVLNGTEVNPSFMSELREAAPDAAVGIVVLCNLGGVLMEPGTENKGQQSRSLMAAYELTCAGYEAVCVLDGGYLKWVREERPIVYYE